MNGKREREKERERERQGKEFETSIKLDEVGWQEREERIRRKRIIDSQLILCHSGNFCDLFPCQTLPTVRAVPQTPLHIDL